MNLKSNFNDYFEGSYFLYQNEIHDTMNIINNNIWIYFCIFSILNDRALYCQTTNQLKLCIENSFFERCYKSNDKYGAILFDCGENGASIISKICANNCSSTQFHFGYIRCSTNFQNNLFFSSISLCSPSFIYGLIPIYFYGGYQNNTNNNITKNYVTHHSSIDFYKINYLNLTFFNILSNSGSGWTSAVFDGQSNCQVKQFNFINNSHFTPSYGLIFNAEYAQTIIENSIFLLNSEYLFHKYTGSLSIRNSNIQTLFSQSNSEIINNLGEITTNILISFNCDYLIFSKVLNYSISVLNYLFIILIS